MGDGGTGACIYVYVCPVALALAALTTLTTLLPSLSHLPLTNRFDALVMRFEEPDGSRRWDSPLFTVLPEDVTPPLEEIHEALTLSKASQAKLATLVVCFCMSKRSTVHGRGIMEAMCSSPFISLSPLIPLLSPINPSLPPHLQQQPVGASNDVHDGDRVTQRIVDTIMAQVNGEGGDGAIPPQGIEVPDTTVKALIPADGCTLAEIRRLRRQFLKLSSGRVQGSRQGTVATLFVEYINTNLH